MKKQLLFVSALVLGGSAFGQTIMSENFNATTGTALPAGWTQTTLATDGGYKSGTADGLSSTYFPIPSFDGTRMVGTNDDDCNCNKSADLLISPMIDLSSATAAVVEADVFFAGATYQGSTEEAYVRLSVDGGTTWTPLHTIAGDPAGWQSLSLNLSSALGQNDVKIAFLYNDDAGWMFGMAIDNFVVRQPQPDDAALVNASLNRFSAVSTNNTLGLSVKNVGVNAITSLTVNWNDGTDHSSVISTNIAPGATANINHPTAISYATAVERNIAVTITNVNGNTDPNMGNNAGARPFNTVSQVPDKAVVIEEGTGTWCGWCPRGAVAMEYMENTYPNDFIGIAVHNDDPMTVTEYDSNAGISAFPGANVDRVMMGVDVSDQDFDDYYNARTNIVSPAAITATSSGSGSSVVVDVTATFYTPFAASNYRLGVIMVEDNVTGTTSGYNQTNYYSSQSQNLPLTGAGHNWQTEPATVPAANMEYDHVGRALVGGYNGQTGSVPAAITDGQVVTYTFNYTVPGSQNRGNMHAVAVLIDQASGEIMNAKEISIATVGISEAATIGMEVFPNPATDVVNVKFDAQGGTYTVSLTDLSGRSVAAPVVSSTTGVQQIALPVNGLASGNYLVTIATEGASYTQHVVIK